MIDLRHEPTFESAGAPRPAARRAHRRGLGVPLAVLVLLLAAALAWNWYSRLPTLLPTPMHPQRAVEDGPAPTPPPAATSGPVHAPAPAMAGQPLSAAEVGSALEQLLGREVVLRFLQATDLPRRLVATIDALGRDHAPVAAWPVQVTPGRFATEDDGKVQRIAGANAARYQPFVDFATGVDPAQVAALYGRLYPLLQQSYRDLGFGDRNLNDRVLQVIDLLLATPEPQGAPAVLLAEVKGPFAPVQPWTRYTFADPALESLTAGQKILLRVGPANRARLKAQLRALRTQLMRGATR
jgi:hypothetical protein